MSDRIKVCVIGAGAAGLSALRHLVHPQNDSIDPVLFEQGNSVGGTWIFDDDANQAGDVHSSMYQSLKTNLPKEVMAFPDFPFPAETSHSFLHHTEVLR